MAEEKKLSEEKMSDEELDGVAGGNVDETMRDSWFLNSLNGSCERHADFGVVLDMTSEEITNAWSTVGVRAEINSFGFGKQKSNRYWIGDKEVTQEQARQHAMNFVGKQMKESDWNSLFV